MRPRDPNTGFTGVGQVVDCQNPNSAVFWFFAPNAWEVLTKVLNGCSFNDRFWVDFAGHPHTEQLHVIERYRRRDFDHLEYETTIEDPGAYTKPFTMYGYSTYQHGEELMEYICNENNKDLPHIVGKDPRNRYFKK